MTSKKLFIGVDPEYQRKQDVEIQTKLARPRVRVWDNLDHVIDDVVRNFENW